ncbi:hypothetical protein C4D60_Mb08t15970 [Musa balbisiana]|uniref:Uncharacterized protein n=1 Tax=Musa balbisiana TaxID=52838 RepID=A0A4S8K437_MUSBA|nr:hypothetical protein C4D60_Mb08t15970 [Musa balbisiana]
MAGWSSPFQDPNHVKVQRNRSLTRGEINAFWKEKKSKEEYVGAVNGLVDSNQENINIGSREMLQPSGDLPLRDRKQSILNSSTKSDADILKTNCWWTRSSYAFLNATPVTSMEDFAVKLLDYCTYVPVRKLCCVYEHILNVLVGGVANLLADRSSSLIWFLKIITPAISTTCICIRQNNQSPNFWMYS